MLYDKYRQFSLPKNGACGKLIIKIKKNICGNIRPMHELNDTITRWRQQPFFNKYDTKYKRSTSQYKDTCTNNLCFMYGSLNTIMCKIS